MQGSSTALQHAVHHAIHVHYTCTRENVEFLIFEFWNFVKVEGLENLSKGYPLRDEITGVFYSKVSMKSSKNGAFFVIFVKNG